MKRSRRKLSIILILLIALPLLYLIWAQWAITQAAKHQPEQGLPYMVVLGAALRGETMSLSLSYRMQTALQYLNNNPDTIAIVSGGQGPGESVTEASAMRKYLIQNGIDPERIIMEDQSTSTLENIRYSLPLLEGSKALIVTNDFHIYRSKLIAKRLGLEVDTLAAPTPDVVKFKLQTREYAALLKSLLLDW